MSSKKNEVAEALKALETMGPAVALIAANCRGQRIKSCQCPVSRYVSERVGESWAVSYAVAYNPIAAYGEWVELPPEVAKFVSDFDRGRYPELEL